MGFADRRKQATDQSFNKKEVEFFWREDIFCVPSFHQLKLELSIILRKSFLKKYQHNCFRFVLGFVFCLFLFFIMISPSRTSSRNCINNLRKTNSQNSDWSNSLNYSKMIRRFFFFFWQTRIFLLGLRIR